MLISKKKATALYRKNCGASWEVSSAAVKRLAIHKDGKRFKCLDDEVIAAARRRLTIPRSTGVISNRTAARIAAVGQ